jgi:hypothetical protein
MTAVVLLYCVPTFAPPTGLAAQVGKRVVLEGTAANAKLGALLLTGEGQVWIDGLDYWPEEVVNAEGKAQRLRVVGTLTKRDDVPVFVYRPGDPVPQGCPARTEAEREKLKWRYLVKGAKWAVLEK